MNRELQIDTSELTKLKGISIGITSDEQLFVHFAYEKEKRSNKAFRQLFWLAAGVLYAACGFMLWWAFR